MIDVSALVGDIPTVEVTLRRFAASSINVFGEVEDGAATDAARTVVVHPADRRTLEREKLDYRRETIAIYSTESLLAAPAAKPDRVLYQGEWYEMAAVMDYIALGGICIGYAHLIQQAEGTP